MPAFDDTRKGFRAAQAEEAQARTRLIHARERARKLDREIQSLSRAANTGSGEAATARLSELKLAAGAAAQSVERRKARLAQAKAVNLAALDLFAAFTDPTEAVSRLGDDTPIALFPLRLETRFKRQFEHGAPQQFLWVRVFPDDVLVDSFQPEMSEAEIANVTTYWTHIWRAAGEDSGKRSAWAALVRSYGAGRAKWLIDRYAPLNAADEPVFQPGEHILVIRPPTPVPVAERVSIAAFWSQVWASGGIERDLAYAALETILGAARAAEVEAGLAPVNLFDVNVRPDPSLAPVVAFLDLPDPATLETSVEDWTRGAHSSLLPERLVLMGYKDGSEVLRETGEQIPPSLQVGPDPAADDADQLQAGGADIEVPEGLKWTVDFEEAVAKGMGFSVNLTEAGIDPEFDRLFVLGVRIGSDADEGATELADLIGHHQASRKGLSILPQGRATNNTEAGAAAYTWWENPDESYAHFFEADPADDPTDWRTRKDGAWLAGLLGIDPAVLRASPHYYGTDQAEARAVNVALWPATLGYYMEQMMEPVFTEDVVKQTRDFFNRYVIGRGTAPLVRIGRQPYGILPATVWSELNWWSSPGYARTARKRGMPESGYLNDLSALIERGVLLWENLADRVGFVGDPGADAQQTLLDIVGLHPTSAEFYQRYSQSFTQHYNALGFATEPVTEPLTAAARMYVQVGLLALSEMGWSMSPGDELPELLEKIFLKEPNLLKGDLVTAELSDTASLPVERADGLNYVAWLQAATRTSHDVLRKQEGFSDAAPNALLYLMLRHALDLGFVETSLQLRREALQLSEADFRAERKEPKFMYVDDQGGASRWTPLYQPEPVITGDAALQLGDFIPTILTTRKPYLNTQLTALDSLKEATSGSLERAFVEHIDCLTYRLDAWRMGMQSAQLSHMRQESETGYAKGGIYIGAYGWLEDVKPKEQSLGPVRLEGELDTIFNTPDEAPVMRDSSNFGHIHAPSLDHAVTAGILRNGHLANATPEAPGLLAVDLSSERVRLAQQVIEGIRNGQSLGALLGYRLERALHDEPDLFLDRMIYELRKEFPLAGNRNLLTRLATTQFSRISQMEARNVVDGAAFMEHVEETGEETYPYGLSGLPPLSDFTGPGVPGASEIGAIIDAHVAQMRSVGDAVGDLAIAEGVYQVVRGNYDRAAGSLDAFSKGTHPPEPEVVATPRGGKTLTHRIGLHLPGGLSPADPVNTTPRARGEPALAQWLAGQMPDPATVIARVSWHDTASATDISLTPSMDELGLAPVDLFYLVDAGGARDMPGFDDLLIDFAVRTGAPAPRDDAGFSLEYKPAGVAGLTLFELAPLVRALRGTILGARPLRPTDLSLQNEASTADDAMVIVRPDKAQAVLAGLQATLPAIDSFIANLDSAAGESVDPVTARDAARDNIDQWVTDYADMLRPVLPFSLQAASLTTAIEGRRERFATLHASIAELLTRWVAKQGDHDAVMVDYAALPGGASDEERTALLIRAGRIVSTAVITPLPALVSELENRVALLRGDLDAAVIALRVMHDSNSRVGALLQAISAFVPTIATVDQAPFETGAVQDSLLALARDLIQKASFLRDDINRRIGQADDALTRAAAAAGDKAQAAITEAIQAILGKAFLLLPEFALSAERLAEWDNGWAGRDALLNHLRTGPEATPYPVEDWLHGVARVRERLRHLEMASLLGDAIGAANELSLQALQFPYRANDVWLALEFPATMANGDPFVFDEDKLLYAAHFGPGAAIDPSQPGLSYSGLLLDEWIEVIPTEQETTGLAFHFDRPNSEAPQAILLATPPVFTGEWQWQNLVDTLHETLDFARLRAVEPAHVDQSALNPLLPAVMSAVTMFPITAMLNFALNNNIQLALAEFDIE